MKKPSIALVELYDHYEVLSDFARTIDTDRFHLVSFVHERFREVDDPTQKIGQWIFLTEDRIFGGQYLMHTLRQYDLVLVLTLATHFRWWDSTLRGLDYFLLLHNIDPMLRPLNFQFYPLDVPNLLRALKATLQVRIKRNLLRRSLGIGFLSERVLTRAKQIVHDKYSWVEVPPIRSWKSAEIQLQHWDDRRLILVPSTVRSTGRDYVQFYEALDMLGDMLMNLRVVFLGKAATKKAKSIVHQFEGLHAKGMALVSFDCHVSTELYEQYFRSANLIICPFGKYQQVGPYRSTIGKDMCSGVMQDLVRYGKRGIVPESYPIDESLEPYIISYSSSSDLSTHIQRSINEGANSRSSKLLGNSLTEESQTPRMSSWINELIMRGKTLIKREDA